MLRTGPQETESELARYRRQTAELRRRAAQLREEAEQAKEHAVAAIRDVELRRLGQAYGKEEAEFRAEGERGARELAAYIEALRREQEMLRDETALQDEWFREQVVSMLNQGWKREQLAEAGFGEELLADLGLLDHPALRPVDQTAGETAGQA